MALRVLSLIRGYKRVTMNETLIKTTYFDLLAIFVLY